MVRGLGSLMVVSSVHSYRVDYWNSCLNIYTDTHIYEPYAIYEPWDPKPFPELCPTRRPGE
jgi:hypothetical protein